MNLQKIYIALLSADLAAAEGWYTKLLGRGPDNRPMARWCSGSSSTKAGLRFPATMKLQAGA